MNPAMLLELKRREIIQICHSGMDTRMLRAALLKHLRAVIPFDYAYFSTTDPATQLGTSAVLVEEPPSWCMGFFLENEFLQTDFNKFGDLVKSQAAVGILSQATEDDLWRSQRYREMLRPMEMGDELRAIFVSGAACWGTLCLHREQAKTPYTEGEAAFLAQLTPHIADGLRKALLLNSAFSPKTPDEPGVLIVSEDLDVVSMTPAAEYWLAELTEMEQIAQNRIPLAVRSVATQLRAVENGHTPNTTPRIRLRTRTGHWLVLYASRLRNSAHLSIIFELAQPIVIAPIMMQAYALTKREGEVTQCVLYGCSTQQIAARLHISQNTVQDHLKAIFEKVAVGSRGELAARIFAQQYHPKFNENAPLNALGQFKQPP